MATTTTPGPTRDVSVPTPSGARLVLALAVAAVAAAASGFTAASLASAVAPAWAADPVRLAPVVIAVVYAAIVIALLAVMGRTHVERRNLLSLRGLDRRSVALGVAAWAGAYVAAVAVYALMDPITGTDVDDLSGLLLSIGADNGRLHEASPPLVATILVRILILSSIVEELIFRGALYTWLRTKLPAWTTILVTGLGFALVHQSPVFLPLAVLVGITAGWIREKTGSVAVPIAVHAMQSGVIVALSLVLTSWNTPTLLH